MKTNITLKLDSLLLRERRFSRLKKGHRHSGGQSIVGMVAEFSRQTSGKNNPVRTLPFKLPLPPDNMRADAD
jgi:hypothetical protein